jgi:hypothetical protein
MNVKRNNERVRDATSEKFKNIPVEEDTKILFRQQITFGPYEAIHEEWKWVFEGIKAESLILLESDVAALTDEELERALRETGLVEYDSKVTIARDRDGYTFLSFNFVVN